MHQPTPARSRRSAAFRWVLVALLCAGLLGFSLGLPQTPRAQADVEAQFTFFPIFTSTPTPTRTPTPINVGNFVWDDYDKDGRQDAGEPGLPGVTVQLWNSTKTSLIGTTTTNGSGIYTLVAPTPGNYRVRVLLPNPLVDSFTGKDLAGGSDTLDSDINPTGSDSGFTDVYVFASNLISITSIDAGIAIYRTPTPTRTPTPINIGNFVWRDTDGDGVQDVGETGVGAALVQLWNASKSVLVDSDYTNASGNYTVVAPTPGDYRIRVIIPGGVSFSPKDQGANDQLDSDINASGTDYGFSDAFNLASNVISTTIYDVGLINAPASFPTPSPTATVPTSTPTLSPTPTLTLTPDLTLTYVLLDQSLWLPVVQKEP